MATSGFLKQQCPNCKALVIGGCDQYLIANCVEVFYITCMQCEKVIAFLPVREPCPTGTAVCAGVACVRCDNYLGVHSLGEDLRVVCAPNDMVSTRGGLRVPYLGDVKGTVWHRVFTEYLEKGMSHTLYCPKCNKPLYSDGAGDLVCYDCSYSHHRAGVPVPMRHKYKVIVRGGTDRCPLELVPVGASLYTGCVDIDCPLFVGKGVGDEIVCACVKVTRGYSQEYLSVGVRYEQW